MKRVLVTGASGFIGRHALPLLAARGYEVHAVSSAAGAEEEGVSWHWADLLEPGAGEAVVERVLPTHLLHLAWYAVPGAYWSSPENLRWVEASLRLVAAFGATGGERAVVAGTCAEYDWRHGFCSEAVTPLLPRGLYGTCKHALRAILEASAEAGGPSVAWGRIFFLYGPYEHPDRLVASVIRALLRGAEAPLSHGAQVRDFLHVEDVASAFVALLESDARGAVNVGSGEPVTIRELASIAAGLVGGPELLAFGRVTTALDDPPLLVADARRLRDEVGWRPAYDLERGLGETIDWWRAADGVV